LGYNEHDGSKGLLNLVSQRRPTWLQHALAQASARTQAETLTIAALVVFVAILVGALYLAQATATATTGFDLEAMVKTRDSFQRNNEDLQAQIAHKKNVSDLRGRAQALGFQPVSTQEYLVINGYQPDRATPTPVVTAMPTYIYDETFNGWAQVQWAKLSAQFDAWSGRANPTASP